MTQENFIADILDETGLSLRGLAKQCGTSHSTLLRQTEEGFKADTILDMARATHLPFLDLAVRSEIITPDEADQIAQSAARPDINAFSDEDLAREMLRRAKARKSSILNQSISRPNLSVVSDRPMSQEGARAAKHHTEDVPEDTP